MYTAKDIEVLEGLEGIRKKPCMYVGDINSNAVFQIIKEVCDNVIDEYLYHACNKLFIEIDEDIITIADNGRGIPVENHLKTGFSTLTTILTRIHAGGKFSNKEITIGTHGIGVSATNALSSFFEIWTYRAENFKENQNCFLKKTWYYQKFKEGLPITEVMVTNKIPIQNWDKGTIVRFTPDKSIFTKNYRIPIKEIKNWFSDIKYLCPGLKFLLKIKDKTIIYESKQGISQWIIDFIENKDLKSFGNMFEYCDKNIQVSLQWTNYIKENISTYVNCCYTISNGSHYIGLCKAINKALKNFSNESYSKEDLRIGLIGLLHTKIVNPTFSTQTKEKLTSTEVEELVKETLTPLLTDFFQKNKSLVDMIIAKAVKLKEARDLFKKNRNVIKDITLVNKYQKHILPGVLLAAVHCKPNMRELFICEGKSAMGTLKDARNPKFQEVLPLKGKFTNVIKIKDSKVFKNQDIKNIFTSIGSNIDVKNIYLCDPNKARVGKIILLPDQDADGAHIKCLLLSLLITYMKELIEKGMVYVVDAPLFLTSYKDKKYYGNTLKDIRKQLPNKAKVYITRMKGWGEASKEDMRKIAMNPETRKLFKITLESKCIEKIKELMGNESIYRKNLLGI